jgi:hypothetical protein
VQSARDPPRTDRLHDRARCQRAALAETDHDNAVVEPTTVPSPHPATTASSRSIPIVQEGGLGILDAEQATEVGLGPKSSASLARATWPWSASRVPFNRHEMGNGREEVEADLPIAHPRKARWFALVFPVGRKAWGLPTCGSVARELTDLRTEELRRFTRSGVRPSGTRSRSASERAAHEAEFVPGTQRSAGRSASVRSRLSSCVGGRRVRGGVHTGHHGRPGQCVCKRTCAQPLVAVETRRSRPCARGHACVP